MTFRRCPAPHLHILQAGPPFRRLDLGLLKVYDRDEVGVRPTVSKKMPFVAGQRDGEEEKLAHLIHQIGKTSEQLMIKIINQHANSRRHKLTFGWFNGKAGRGEIRHSG